MPVNKKSLENLRQYRSGKAELPAGPKSEANRTPAAETPTDLQTVDQVFNPSPAAEILQRAAPGAAATLAAAANGARGVPWHVKVQAAIRLLESTGDLPKQTEQPRFQVGSALASRLREALELRRRKLEAADAVTVTAETVDVDADAGSGSQAR